MAMIRLQSGREIDDETRAALASGRADPSVALFIDAVLALRGLTDYAGDVLAGAALEQEAPAAMSAGALAAVFARIDGDAAAKQSGRLGRDELIRLPPAVQSVIRDAEAKDGWRWGTPGIRILPLASEGMVRAEIIHIDAGVSAPRHTHAGREYSLCLAGGFSDDRGSYGPGDVAYADPDVTHRPTGDADGPSLVLVITDAELRYTGALGVLQRLFS